MVSTSLLRKPFMPTPAQIDLDDWRMRRLECRRASTMRRTSGRSNANLVDGAGALCLARAKHEPWTGEHDISVFPTPGASNFYFFFCAGVTLCADGNPIRCSEVLLPQWRIEQWRALAAVVE